MLTYIEMPGQTELKQCDYVIQGDNEAVSLNHRLWNITASPPNAIANYLCWAQLASGFDTSGGCHLFFNGYQP